MAGPSDWINWKGGNPNIKAPTKANPISIEQLEDVAVLPKGTDPRESDVYVLISTTGNAKIDKELAELVESYNTIAKLRRSVIVKLNQKFMKNKRVYDSAGDMKMIKDMTEKAKTLHDDLKRRNAKPLKFPKIFDERPCVPPVPKN